MVPMLAWLLLLTLGVPAVSGAVSQVSPARQYMLRPGSTYTNRIPIRGRTEESGSQFSSDWHLHAADRHLGGVGQPLDRLSTTNEPACQKTSTWDCAMSCQSHIMKVMQPCATSSSQDPRPGPGFAVAYERSSELNNRVLCFSAVAFINRTTENVMENMLSSVTYCDWALISYSGEAAAWAAYLNEFTAPGHPPPKDRVRIVADLKQARLVAPSQCDIPFTRKNKLQGWRQLVEDYGSILDEYAMIHLLDDDMVLSSFNIERFMDDVVCGQPLGPPMISQPTTFGQEKYFPFLRQEFWDQQAHVPSSIEVTYVEIQAPLVVMSFFRWFMTHIYLAQTHLMWATDWGIDHVWCNAGRHYMAEEMKISISDIDAGQRLSCAIYPKTPMRTQDFSNLGDIVCDGFVRRGLALAAAYKAAYPYWFQVVEPKSGRVEMVIRRTFEEEPSTREESFCNWRTVLSLPQ